MLIKLKLSFFNGIFLISFFVLSGCCSNKGKICNITCKIDFIDEDNIQIQINNHSSRNMDFSPSNELNMTLCIFENKTFSDKLFLGCAVIKRKVNIIAPNTSSTQNINLKQIEFGSPIYKNPAKLGGIVYSQTWEDIKREPVEKCAYVVIAKKRKSKDDYRILKPYWFTIFSNTVKCPISKNR